MVEQVVTERDYGNLPPPDKSNLGQELSAVRTAAQAGVPQMLTSENFPTTPPEVLDAARFEAYDSQVRALLDALDKAVDPRIQAGLEARAAELIERRNGVYARLVGAEVTATLPPADLIRLESRYQPNSNALGSLRNVIADGHVEELTVPRFPILRGLTPVGRALIQMEAIGHRMAELRRNLEAVDRAEGKRVGEQKPYSSILQADITYWEGELKKAVEQYARARQQTNSSG